MDAVLAPARRDPEESEKNLMTVRPLTDLLQTSRCVAALILASVSSAAIADAPAAITLTLKNHRFTPSAFDVPAGQKVRVTVINQDPAEEEFDSRDLGVEEVVTPLGRTSFDIGPLKPGEYRFMGEFHHSTAQGSLTARP
jgi:plastocyanin